MHPVNYLRRQYTQIFNKYFDKENYLSTCSFIHYLGIFKNLGIFDMWVSLLKEDEMHKT